jgi:hypothetical protein
MEHFSNSNLTSLVNTQTTNSLPVNTQTTNSLPITWSTYSNKKLGISFEYPSTWTVEEKTNRFDTFPDVLVSNDKDKPFQAFKVINHQKGIDSGLKTLGPMAILTINMGSA